MLLLLDLLWRMTNSFCPPNTDYFNLDCWPCQQSIHSLHGAKCSSPFPTQNEVAPALSKKSYSSIDFSSAKGLTSRHLWVLQGLIWIMRLKALFLCIWWKQLPPILHSWDTVLLELPKFTWWSCGIKVLLHYGSNLRNQFINLFLFFNIFFKICFKIILISVYSILTF